MTARRGASPALDIVGLCELVDTGRDTAECLSCHGQGHATGLRKGQGGNRYVSYLCPCGAEWTEKHDLWEGEVQ